VKVKIKKLDEMAQLPKYAKDSDAGMDLTAVSKNETKEYIEYGTGLAIEIPEGYVGLVFPRSSISNESLALANAVGVIDSGYRGEIKARFKRLPNSYINGDGLVGEYIKNPQTEYQVSDRIAQLIIMPYPKIEFEVTDELVKSARGVGGFGSTEK
jgi:dUTP pyrophosphatase